MDKNTIWFIAASAAFLLLWYKFFPSQNLAPQKQPVTAQAGGKSEIVSSGTPASSEAELKWLKKPGKIIPIAQSDKTIETVRAKVVMDSRGASVKHWWVKNGKPPVDLVNTATEDLPLATFPDIIFEQVQGTPPGQAEWKSFLPSGIEIRKKLSLDPESSFAEIEIKLKNLTSAPVDLEGFGLGWQKGLGTLESLKKENESDTRIIAYPTPSKETQVFKTGTHQQNFKWVAMDNRYYLFAMFPDLIDFNVIEVEKNKTQPGKVRLAAPPLRLSPAETRIIKFRVYAGAKGYHALKSWGLGLEHAVDFGFFGFLGKAALKAMAAVYKFTNNYGVSIILLTLGLQVILFPFTLTSYKSMAIMKRLQPKMQEIQARYKDDAKRLSSEMMNLYKQAGTTPFSGCLPMLAQMPVFIAFFTMLRNSYELSGAPFAFWITDLSQHDTYYILPILTGGIMYLQQFLSGSMVSDPMQKNMMLLMPAVFTVMFIRSPSGLALYWLTNSLASMGVQQWATRKYTPKTKT